MKLVEIQAEEFNKLTQSEPNSSFFQTSNWGDFYSNFEYTPYYLGYVDEQDLYSAFGLFLVQKGSFFSKKQALCPSGFLINYFDTQLLKDFSKDVKKFLSKKGASNLIISPNVKYLTAKGNNDLLIKNMADIGFIKTKSTAIYTTKIGKIKRAKATDDICLKAYTVEENNHRLFETNPNYKQLHLAMKNNAKFVVCELDCKKSLEKLTASIAECKNFNEIHQDDFEYFEKIDKNKIDIQNKQKYIELIKQIINDNANPIIAVTCLIEFNNKITQLFIDGKKEYEAFNSLNVLKQETLKTITKLGYESFDSILANEDSTKTDLIGEFTYRIK